MVEILAASKIFVILDPLTQRDRTSGKADRYRRKRCGRWCGTDGCDTFSWSTFAWI